MFKKLRFRLLIMNLAIMSILLLISFFTVYFLTSNNIYRSVNQELQQLVEQGTSHNNDDKNSPSKPNSPSQDMNPSSNTANSSSNTMTSSLPPSPNTDNATSDDSSANTDNSEIGDNTSETAPTPPNVDAFDTPQRLITCIVETNENGDIIHIRSVIPFDDNFYTEAISAIEETHKAKGTFSTDDRDWLYRAEKTDSGSFYVFIDISSQKRILSRLIYSFIFVTIFMFIFIYFISRFLTNRSITPIQEAFEKQKQFISDASHELKTPLAVIQTNVDVLIEDTPKDSDTLKWLEYIKSEAIRMTHLTKDLLYLTHIDGNNTKEELMQTAFNFSEQLEQVMLGMEVYAYEKEINFSYDIQPNLTIIGNKEQLTQVAMILLDNAMKYTSKDGQVTLTVKRLSHQVILDVTNTGEGIPEKDLPHIFDRFYRVDKSRSRASGSHGLGLSIARAIIEQHRGKITCSSILGKSTTFTVKLRV